MERMLERSNRAGAQLQPNTYNNPYAPNYIPPKAQAAPAAKPTTNQAKQPSKEELLAATIKRLEDEKSGEIVKEERTFGRKLKRGKLVGHKQSDPNCECFECVTSWKGKTQSPEENREIENLVDALLKALLARDLGVSRQYATDFILANDKKLIPAMTALLDDLRKTEARILNLGRVNLEREIHMATSVIRCVGRDRILHYIEMDDKCLLELEKHGWKSRYGQVILRKYRSAKDHCFAMYTEDNCYRKRRRRFFLKAKHALDSNKMTAQEFKDAMAGFDIEQENVRNKDLEAREKKFGRLGVINDSSAMSNKDANTWQPTPYSRFHDAEQADTEADSTPGVETQPRATETEVEEELTANEKV